MIDVLTLRITELEHVGRIQEAGGVAGELERRIGELPEDEATAFRDK